MKPAFRSFTEHTHERCNIIEDVFPLARQSRDAALGKSAVHHQRERVAGIARKKVRDRAQYRVLHGRGYEDAIESRLINRTRRTAYPVLSTQAWPGTETCTTHEGRR